MKKHFIFIFCIAFFHCLNSSAQSDFNTKISVENLTDWTITEGGRIRVIADLRQGSTLTQGVIEVQLKQGWKTYWSNPGSAGMAPFFELDNGLKAQIQYPTPELFQADNEWSLGYKNNVLLPFKIFNRKANQPLSGSLTIGVCKDICIPVNIVFNFSNIAKKSSMMIDTLIAMGQDALPQNDDKKLSISANIVQDRINVTFYKINTTTQSKLYLDGHDLQIGPANIVERDTSKIVFSAKILFKPSTKTSTINYIFDDGRRAISGTFLPSEQ